jgi:hypothetical protein
MMNHVSITVARQPTDKHVSTICRYSNTSPIFKIILRRVAVRAALNRGSFYFSILRCDIPVVY